MMPVGLLMKEHRTIERMIKLLKKEAARPGAKVDLNFVSVAVDFLRTYADRCHHGKEEDILFAELAKKPLSPEHKKIMVELVADHVYARQVVSELENARNLYAEGKKEAAKEIKALFEKLAAIYPPHIEKEDKRFFLPVMNYLSAAEQEAMIQKCYTFDKDLIHEKYKKIVAQLETVKI